MKTQIIKYEILRLFGGVYIDIKLGCCKRLDELLLDYSLISYVYDNTNNIHNSKQKYNQTSLLCDLIIGSSQSNDIITKLLNNIDNIDNIDNDKDITSCVMTLISSIDDNKIKLYPIGVLREYVINFDIISNQKNNMNKSYDEFDWELYLINNPDVAKHNCTKEFSLLHWTTTGKKEGRTYHSKNDTNKSFNWTNYIQRYPDLTINGIKSHEQALHHYIFTGQYEGRDAS